MSVLIAESIRHFSLSGQAVLCVDALLELRYEPVWWLIAERHVKNRQTCVSSNKHNILQSIMIKYLLLQIHSS